MAICLAFERPCATCDNTIMHIGLAKIHKQEAELHKMQWQPEILELIRYMVRMDIQHILGAKIKASAWRAVHKQLLSKAPGLYVHGRAEFGPVEFDYKTRVTVSAQVITR
jgi:hypothetical protein